MVTSHADDAPRCITLLTFVTCLLACCMSTGCQRRSESVTPTPTTIDKANSAADSRPVSEEHAAAALSDEPSTDTDLLANNDAATDRPRQAPHDGYVSSAACLECHPNEHDSWNQSYHRSMTQLVNDDTVAGGFDGKTKQIFDWSYTAEKRGEEYWCKLDTNDGSGDSFEYQLVMSTGSHHMQKFWYHTGKSRKMGMAPLVYLIEADKWMPESSAFLGPPDRRLHLREGDWNTGCSQCHATGSHPRISSPDEMDTLVAEFGISCEACHGPGATHVAAKTAETIVNPRNLSAERSSQACGQCHGAWIRTEKARETKWSQTGNAYRPGQDLFELRYYPHGAKDTHLHARIKAVESFWKDGEVRVAGREFNGLLSSPCHTHDVSGVQRMSCISCHDLHSDAEDKTGWANDQLASGMNGNEACLQCHDTMRENLTAHTHHAADSAGSLCYNCHMPFTSYGLLKAVRTHTIVTPSAKNSLATGKPNGCNQCHLDQTLDWTAKKLSEWYGHDPLNIAGDHCKIAASVMWSLNGDAAQRALMAWSMGWEDARQISGDDWMVFFLVDLMFDDYDAIRYIAFRSLRQIPGFESIQYDHLRPQQERGRVMDEIFTAWQAKTNQRPTDAKLLYQATGDIMYPTYQRLKQSRDNRPILLTE